MDVINLSVSEVAEWRHLKKKVWKQHSEGLPEIPSVGRMLYRLPHSRRAEKHVLKITDDI